MIALHCIDRKLWGEKTGRGGGSISTRGVAMTLLETVHRLDMSFACHDPGVDAVCRTPSTCERAMERGV